ncbi:microsomal triglyceride transfer protein large subunit-like [Pelobates fuscus]|uniref:microsomal triglyceride transfer protein large subunit-like n=1 Tax=Pelobates fuscus TaxID=191477 RepID=UPI002FE449A2
MSLGSSCTTCTLHLIILLICCCTCIHSKGPSFKPETSYRYHYTIDLKIDHVSQVSVPGTSLKFDANIQTHVLWRNKNNQDDQLVNVQIQDFVFQHLSSKNNVTGEDFTFQQLSTSNMLRPVLFHWTSGEVVGLYVTKDDNGQTLELKKGLVSLFQFQPLTGIYTEEDVTGKCSVTYVTSNDLIKKTKHLRSCTNSPLEFDSDEKVLGVSWNSTSRGHALLNHSIIQTATSEENHTVSLRVKSNLGSHITSRQVMELIATSPGSPEVHGISFEKVLEELPEKYQKIEITSHQLERSKENFTLPKYLEFTKTKSLKLNVAKASTTREFHKMVKFFRHAKKSDILQYLQKASGDLLPFLLDAVVIAQTPATVSALSEFLDFSKKKQAPRNEKFLYSAAFAPNPSMDLLNLVLEKLKGKVNDPSVMETGIIVMGAIIGKLCRMGLCDFEDVQRAKATLVKGLNNAEDDVELKIYLLSLKNAQLPETIDLLLDYAEDNSGVVCSTALLALKDFPAEHISTKEVKDTLKNIFHQTHQKYHKKCRLIAAEILLATDYSHANLIKTLLSANSIDKETTKLLLSKIQNRLTFKHPLMKPSNTVLENKYLNYNEFSQPGSSTSFSGLLTANENMVSTFGVDLLFTETGFLKRSVSDITLFDQVHQLKAMQVSIEAQGLESLIGGGSAEESEDEAMVGMSATLFDVQLRPVVFFEGYMDLMSKVFSSSGDPISVVKGTVQLIDYNQHLPLQSGLQPIIECQVGIGLDILAKIDVMLWEQKCKTNVNTTAGLVMEFNTGLDTSFFKADLKSHVEAETTVSLDSMMALVSSPMDLCIELSHGDLPYRETYILSEYFAEKNITHTIQKGRKSTVWGRDFPLSTANSQMCSRVKYEEDQYNS